MYISRLFYQERRTNLTMLALFYVQIRNCSHSKAYLYNGNSHHFILHRMILKGLQFWICIDLMFFQNKNVFHKIVRAIVTPLKDKVMSNLGNELRMQLTLLNKSSDLGNGQRGNPRLLCGVALVVKKCGTMVPTGVKLCIFL